MTLPGAHMTGSASVNRQWSESVLLCHCKHPAWRGRTGVPCAHFTDENILSPSKASETGFKD